MNDQHLKDLETPWRKFTTRLPIGLPSLPGQSCRFLASRPSSRCQTGRSFKEHPNELRSARIPYLRFAVLGFATLVFLAALIVLVTDDKLRYVFEAKRSAPSEAPHVGLGFGGHDSFFQASP